jgi:hypothetical protein
VNLLPVKNTTNPQLSLRKHLLGSKIKRLTNEQITFSILIDRQELPDVLSGIMSNKSSCNT